ncbi:MAG: PKD domain-containing protein, partial [Nanoarchaeota archaeon]|nr:PKD domain-containing protein [Nanoarchaeota archaeon]
MRKIGVLVFLILCFVSLAFASEIKINNISVDSSYPKNQILSGKINISLKDVDLDSIVKTNKGHETTLRKLLNNSGVLALSDCIPQDCSVGFKKSGGQSSLSSYIKRDESKIFGFYINGSRVEDVSLDFKIASNFSASESLPLRIKFFESNDNVWKFNKFSSDDRDVTRPNYGYYRAVKSMPDSSSIRESKYCSELDISETDKILVGCVFANQEGIGELVVKMYDSLGNPIFDDEEHSFNPGLGENGVEFTKPEDEPFSSGNYYFCIEAENKNSTYTLFIDRSDSEEHSSFSYRGEEFNYSAASEEKTKSYSIYVQSAVYDDASALEDVDFSDYTINAESYLTEKYDNDCSNGCYFPFEVYSAVNQQFEVKDAQISYWLDREADRADPNIYSLEKIPTTVSFSGVLDLKALNFVMNETGNYKIYIAGKKIYDDDIFITSAPVILGIYPTIIPAGLESKLIAELDYSGDKDSLTYEWSFGDGSTKTTNTNEVSHLFGQIGEYNVKLTVKDGNLSNYFESKIQTINPKEYIFLIYNQLSFDLNYTRDTIKTFPTWLQPVLEKALNVLGTQDELSRIKRQMDLAVEDQNYLDIASSLNKLNIPVNVFVSEKYSINFPVGLEANLIGISEYSGDSLESGKEEEYSNA